MKTISLKKVSAVAVASLGFGLLSVVPANAADVTVAYTYAASGTATASTTAVAAGTALTLTPTVTVTGTTVTSTTALSAVFVLKNPNGDTATEVPTCTAGADVTGNVTSIVVSGVAAGTCTFASLIGVGAARAGAMGTIVFTPTMGGRYQLFAGNAAVTGANNNIAAVTSATATGTTTDFIHVSGIYISQGTTRAATGAAGVANQAQVFVTLPAQTAAQNYKFTSSGVGVIAGATPVNGANTNISGSATDFSAGLTMLTTGNTTLTTQLLTLTNATTAGVQTIAVTSIAPNTGLATALFSTTVTWSAVAVVGTVSAGNSVSLIDASTATPFAGAAADVVISAPATTQTRQATIKLTLKDTQSTAAIIAAKAVTATITTGPGLLGGSVGTNTDNAYTNTNVTGTLGRAITANTDTIGNVYFGVFGDGTSGVSTITLTQGTTVLATEKVTFYGALASFKATVKKNVAAGGGAIAGALDVVALDANGVVVPTVGITVTSGTTATIASFTEITSTAADVVAGTAVVDVTGISGKFGSVVLTIKDTATGLISTTATVLVGALEAATVTASLNKATYSPGELVTLTISAKDANGADVGDSVTATALAITSNAAVQGTLPTGTDFKLGKQVITFFAPSVGVPLTVSVKLLTTAAWSTALDDTTITASAAVTDGNAAANAAANAALTTRIDSLNAKIVALTALIAKIMKSLKIK